jgi:hypothetical protein
MKDDVNSGGSPAPGVPAPGRLVFSFPGTPAEADVFSRALAHWINDTVELQGLAAMRLVRPRAGEQGGTAEAVEIAVATAPVIAAVTTAFFGWLGERAKNQRVTFEVRRPDGARMKGSASTEAQAAALREDLRRFVAGNDNGNDNGNGNGGPGNA